MRIRKTVAPAFDDYLFDWDYETYVLCGGYGSGKSYHTAFKIVLKLLEERRKALVVRQVYDTINESCYDLLCEILDDMGILTHSPSQYRRDPNKVIALQSPLRINFHNGSKIIFKGLDKPEKIKSINNISLVWLEEATEISYSAYKELQGRLRTPKVSMHFMITFNPVDRNNWVYKHFFTGEDEDGLPNVIVDEQKLYEKKCIVKNGTYYHHSIPTDNPWLPWAYLKRLDEYKSYDPYLYMVARWGHFGAAGTRVLPQVIVANFPKRFKRAIEELGPAMQRFGMDFGFEESYNAVISMSVDTESGILYIWDEIYQNNITDDLFAVTPKMQEIKSRLNRLYEMGYENAIIKADNEDPKAIQYYRQCGFRIRKCSSKFHGSRLSNTRKIKRFKKIIISPKCKNTIRELQNLTYKKDRHGNIEYDKFNIDPHSFSAIWYGLDDVNVADLKEREFNSKAGHVEYNAAV